MSTFTADINKFFPTIDFYKEKELEVKDIGAEALADKQQEIEQKALMSQQTSTSKASNSKLPYIIVGLAIASLITLVILKKKKII